MSFEKAVGVDSAAGMHGDPHRYLRIKAKRKIITEAGTIDPGEVGYVPRTWIEKVVNNRGCACNGSIGWFEFV